MEEIINDLYKQIAKSLPSGDRKEFDNLFAQRLSLFSPSELLKGLPLHKKIVVLRDAITEFDSRETTTTTVTLFTPVVNALFKTLIAISKLEPKGKTPKLKANADLQNPADANQSPGYGSEKAHGKTKEATIKSKSRSRSPTLVKVKPVRKPSDAKIKEIYELLFVTCENGPHPYENFAHIKCKDKQCTFCRSLFYNIAVTPCRGHPKCNKFGWFPHVGTSLWTVLTRSHKPNRVFEPRPHELKADELPSYVSQYKMGPALYSTTPIRPDVMETNELSPGTSEDRRKRPCSSSRSERSTDWSEEVVSADIDDFLDSASQL